MPKTVGIHHITAIVNDPQVNVDFYTKVLGLRLVKKTINFDRPEVYHLYFGNETGDPGTVITFFPWTKLPKGRVGTGQVGVTSYLIPIGSSVFWKDRLDKHSITYTTSTRFGETYIQFHDPDGLQIELVEREEGPLSQWQTSGINVEHAIKGFAGSILYSAKPNRTVEILEEILGMEYIGEEDGYLRYQTSASLGNTIDIKLSPSVRGLAGAGTVHHIAWRARDEQEHHAWRDILEAQGFKPTEIKERNYFKAIYFYDPGGMLFEIATDLPGFAVDEEPSKLGEKLMLPEWLEAERTKYEDILPPIKID
ncbi:ring-cleaving dioxygenase [Oceanobacillus piezotolerans]|uniref:Ring-cleaving dioxygenase n=1 Tax=Oceanobacillus piezotolerans TaxID=2448030 RepID=A0A498DAG6_9BACI|nr:ring-cleaving dioxygenase [Oceanobacillus piezotolerans]RLL46568.1 ring-cleaving dioxygenase [Oceanobacillus piezotolerans]